MKRILVNIMLILGVLTAFSCGTKGTETNEVVDEKLTEQEQQQQIYDEVMKIHDDLMVHMDDLFKIRTALIERADSLEEAGSAVESLRQTISLMEEGEESMMVWMRSFKALPESIPHDSVISYMTDQREKIMAVKDKMEQALAAGRMATQSN